MSKVERGWGVTLEWRRQLRSNMTRAEKVLWEELRNKRFNSLKFRRQHGIGPFIVDFYCAKKFLVIELDGGVHTEEDQISNDEGREEYLRFAGVKVVRFQNEEILRNLNGVLENLRNICFLPSPLLRRGWL